MQAAPRENSHEEGLEISYSSAWILSPSLPIGRNFPYDCLLLLLTTTSFYYESGEREEWGRCLIPTLSAREMVPGESEGSL